MPSLIFAKNILLRERPGSKRRHHFYLFLIFSHQNFNGKIEIVMLRSLHIFQHRILGLCLVS